jgi:hypothetical protein
LDVTLFALNNITAHPEVRPTKKMEYQGSMDSAPAEPWHCFGRNLFALNKITAHLEVRPTKKMEYHGSMDSPPAEP